ncbi:apolipoprotein D-like [Cotesia typhae]|uniref:apolipoprotein D-like n=1 Tax=Cotesia typhae TaxID=2053667 RepID=UPI003D692902
MFGLTIICCVIAAASNQILSFGRCPEPYTPFVLDLSRFAGKYYKVETSFSFWEDSGKCPNSQYIQLPDNQITHMESGIIGRATVNGTKLNVQYHIPVVDDRIRDIWVIDTDHDTFAVLWACTNYGFMHVAYGWTLVRKSYINQDFSARTQAAFKRARVPIMLMRKVEHTNCT